MKMKKTVLILLIAFLSAGITAQGNNFNAVPQKILSAFQLKYPSAQVKKWNMNNDGYVTKFFLNKKEYLAYYTADADWVRTETKIKWTWKLPAAVKTALHSSEYASWYVDEMKQVETPGEHKYMIHVDDGNKLDSDHHDAFKEDFMLYFSANGELIKKEKLP
jgi:hypothetical protein